MSEKEIHMPISLDWSQEEVVDAVHFFDMVSQAYEEGVKSGKLTEAYKKFKRVVPSKSEEKSLFQTYDEAAGVSCWKTVQAAKEKEADETIRMTT
ncbi:uncharacterized protein YktA (UPF0223 family) [Salsuginibacillus halophilus]|uniref:Uncharacterized protein YktA (UPF0223 family) n=1 Tax=Salsuginibacillus halophilus TaxID=517424 RepID=A0A2P8HX72_9BACI|nr:UPF0223 family protein [Salsuginibacillus halophilus]PSL50843.1 uncharacterized protein YktA (UPF0223 family) [Salsuginibacillus halophilus]